MRKNIVAGNWKMNTNISEGITLAKKVNDLITEKNCDIIIAPPLTHISEIQKVIDEKKIFISSQNCASTQNGAYTGEISAQMLKSMSVNYSIIGHSERRDYFKESNIDVKEKVTIAIKNNITPIFCCGEDLTQRERNNHFNVIENQIKESLFDLSAIDFSKIIIAYEPIWAIGTGKTASADQAQEIHKFIRTIVASKYNVDLADNLSILYGGSCKPSNAKELFAKEDIDGGLIGGASLNAEDFVAIINAF